MGCNSNKFRRTKFIFKTQRNNMLKDLSTELEMNPTMFSVVSFLPYMVYFKGCNSEDILYRKLITIYLSSPDLKE